MNRNIIVGVLIAFALLSIPTLSIAHTGSLGNTDSMPMMSNETAGVSAEEFEEIEEVMLKMMNGEELTESQWQEMQEFMEGHHGSFAPFNQMMWNTGGYMNQDMAPFRGGMMWGNYGTFMMWIISLSILIWLLVGILLATYLIKKLNKKK